MSEKMNIFKCVKMLLSSKDWKLESLYSSVRVVHSSGWWYHSDTRGVAFNYKQFENIYWTNPIMWSFIVLPLITINTWKVKRKYLTKE